MLTLLLAAPLFAAPNRLCAATEASVTANGSWEVLGRRDRDNAMGQQQGEDAATAQAPIAFGADRTDDLCPAGDPMGGITLPGRGDLVEVALPQPGQAVEGCVATGSAHATGTVTGAATVEKRRIAGTAKGGAEIATRASNGGAMDVDGGGGGSFVGQWDWRVKGQNTRLTGTVDVTVDPTYGNAWLSVPGLLFVQTHDGKVEAWVRGKDGWSRQEGASPMKIQVDAVLPGRMGAVCASGRASVGGKGDLASGGFKGGSSLALALEPVATEDAASPETGDAPKDVPACGCP